MIHIWSAFNGKPVKTVKYTGLERTREITMYWLTHTHEGTAFNAEVLFSDLQRLGNTGNLYDITAKVDASDGGITVEIIVTDKWTLLPFVGSQGGGGSLVLGLGLYDTNILGLNISGYFAYYYYNGDFSYELNLYQEYIAGTTIEGMIDIYNNINPTIIHRADGSSAGDFVWQRKQVEVLVGEHYQGPLRVGVITDIFHDDLLSSRGVNATIFPGDQYRLTPRVIFGKVNIVDYLEQGSELTFKVNTTNPLGPVTNYQGAEVDFKDVFVSGKNNFAFYLSAAAMTVAPAPYEYEVGGYYNLRGYIDSRQIGPYTYHGNIEYRPLLTSWPMRFFNWIDVDRAYLQGCLFTDFGAAWGDSALTGESSARSINNLWSVGVGIRVNFIKFAGAILRLDVARTVSPDEGWGLSFGIGQFF